MKIKINKNLILVYIEVLLIILLSGTVRASIVSDMLDYRIEQLLCIILGLFFLLNGIRCKQEILTILWIFVASLFVILICYIHFPATIKAFSQMILWFNLFIYLCLFSENNRIDLMDVFYNTLMFLTYISLVLFVLIEIFRLPLPYSILASHSATNRNITYINYFNLYYNTAATHTQGFGRDFYRLNSIFWEPGVYAIYLNFTLFFYLIKEKKKKVDLVVLLASILFTVSTTGYVVAFILVGFYVLKNKKIPFAIRYLLYIPIGVTIILGSIWILNQKRNSASLSYSLRLSDLTYGFEIFRNHIFLGTGYLNTNEFVQKQSLMRGNSNGLITWLFTMGIFGQLIVLPAFLIRLMRVSKESFSKYILFLFLFFISNMTEPIYVCPIIVLVVSHEYYKVFFTNIRHLKTNNI